MKSAATCGGTFHSGDLLCGGVYGNGEAGLIVATGISGLLILVASSTVRSPRDRSESDGSTPISRSRLCKFRSTNSVWEPD